MDFKKVTEELWLSYMSSTDENWLGETLFAPECTIIGTGKHEIYHCAQDFFQAMAAEFQERQNISFQFRDFWCQEMELAPGVVLVYGGLFIWGQSLDSTVTVNMDSRFSMVYQIIDGKWKVVHVHQSLPNLEQAEGEYYPKTLSQQIQERQAQIDTLSQLAAKDGLTGLRNFRSFQELFAAGSREDTWLFVLDLDHFKEINDTYGHLEGNAILKRVADILTASVRTGDEVCRMGGDEFLLLCRNLKTSADAQSLASRIHTAITQAHPAAAPWTTVSIGISRVGEVDTLESALQRADQALYAVKSKDKNGWMFAQE